MRTIVLREFGPAGLVSYRQFRACLLLLAEERLGAKARSHERAEEGKMAKLRGAMNP